MADTWKDCDGNGKSNLAGSYVVNVIPVIIIFLIFAPEGVKRPRGKTYINAIVLKRSYQLRVLTILSLATAKSQLSGFFVNFCKSKFHNR